jgi:hypothetical protein
MKLLINVYEDRISEVAILATDADHSEALRAALQAQLGQALRGGPNPRIER